MPQPGSILYIDDDDGLRRLVSKLLGRRDYSVETAASGAEGVAMAGARRFDLIAVDHYMPGMDGLATLAELQRLPDCPPVIYVTGSEESKVAVAAIKAGAAEYVVKSTGDDFIDLLERAFDQASASVRLKQEKIAAEDALRAANERLQTLLKEVNHRVANSLQLVSTFIHMQSRGLDNEGAREALADTQRRIDAIAQVHRKLYTSDDVESVEMSDYLAAIVEELQGTWSTPDAPRTIVLDVAQLRLHPDKAVSVGVIVNELVSNACKYAYGATGGEIRVQLLRADDRRFALVVEDDGVGMIAGHSPRGSGLGSKLVLAMAKSLAADFDYDPAHTGVRARLVAAI